MKRLKLAALAMALVAAVPHAHALDIEPYLRKDKFEEIKISPKGDFFAASVPLEDRSVLVIIRRSDNKITGNFSLGKNTVVADFDWVNPSRVLISMGEKFGSLDRPSLTGELYAVNADGTQPEILVGQRVTSNTGGGSGSHIQPKKVEAVAAFLVDDLPGDDRSVIISVSPFAADAYSRAEKMDVYTGRRMRVASAPVRNAGFITDHAGVVRFAHGQDIDRATKLYYRKGEGEPWQLLNDENVSGHDEDALGFAEDNRTAYLQVESDKGTDRIVAFDPTTGARKDLLSDPVADPVGILHRPGTRIPVGAAFMPGRVVKRYFDDQAPEARLQRLLEEAFPNATVTVTSETTDGQTALVRVSNDRNPGDYYLFDTKKLKADYLLSNRDWFDPDAMNPATPIEFKARDGLAIHGYLTRPKGSDGKRVPLVVMPHGGPIGIRDYWGFDQDAQMLASAGYAVLQVNYRGSGGYGRSFRYAGARQWGGTMQDDLTDATRWAVSEGIADGSRVCLFGASYGGYASLMGVAKEPTLYRCAAGYVGVYDLPMMYTVGDVHGHASGRNYLQEWMGPRDQVGAVSPSRLADRIKVPVFLAAGGEDERAPIEHSKLMERALIQARVPVETLYFPTEGHGFYVPEHRREFYTKLLAFLSRNIGGEPATPAAKSASR